jgi:ribosomal protein S18 acetylase RimI-like enzyme
MEHTLRVMHKDEFPRVYRLIEMSFPPEEYRPYEEELALFDCPNHTTLVIETDGLLQAFVSEWILRDTRFVEFLAVSPDARGSGLGTEIMREYLNRSTSCIVLEVEAPESLIAQRRVAFYERLGFTLSDIHYIQPALRENSPLVQLQLMYYPHELSREALLEVKRDVLETVYGCPKC